MNEVDDVERFTPDQVDTFRLKYDRPVGNQVPDGAVWFTFMGWLVRRFRHHNLVEAVEAGLRNGPDHAALAEYKRTYRLNWVPAGGNHE